MYKAEFKGEIGEVAHVREADVLVMAKAGSPKRHDAFDP